jgi:hypothetical protein
MPGIFSGFRRVLTSGGSEHGQCDQGRDAHDDPLPIGYVVGRHP